MKFHPNHPPRKFAVGHAVRFEMSDCGSVELEADEQITFRTPSNGEYDVARKAWGFYATPSLNGRLVQFGLRGVLVRNRLTDRYFVLLVECGREESFHAYLVQESCEIITWLDTTESLTRLRTQVGLPEVPPV